MKITQIITIILLITSAATAAATEIRCEEIKINENGLSFNGNCENLKKTPVYTSEDFLVCGTVTMNGTPLEEGTIKARKEGIMPEQTAEIENGAFQLQGKTETKKHEMHYIETNLTEPCEKKLKPIKIESKPNCTQLSPETIQAIPNKLNENQKFTLEVSGADKPLEITVKGLKKEVEGEIKPGETWRKDMNATDCCSPSGSSCNCEIKFSFRGKYRKKCTNQGTSIEVTVESPLNGTKQRLTQVSVTLIVFLVILIPTFILLREIKG